MRIYENQNDNDTTNDQEEILTKGCLLCGCERAGKSKYCTDCLYDLHREEHFDVN